jgi:hypothetical protein
MCWRRTVVQVHPQQLTPAGERFRPDLVNFLGPRIHVGARVIDSDRQEFGLEVLVRSGRGAVLSHYNEDAGGDTRASTSPATAGGSSPSTSAGVTTG